MLQYIIVQVSTVGSLHDNGCGLNIHRTSTELHYFNTTCYELYVCLLHNAQNKVDWTVALSFHQGSLVFPSPNLMAHLFLTPTLSDPCQYSMDNNPDDTKGLHLSWTPQQNQSWKHMFHKFQLIFVFCFPPNVHFCPMMPCYDWKYLGNILRI